MIKNSQTLADELQKGGVALVSGGTDNHLLLADLRPLNLNGTEAEHVLDRAGITVNKNMIPRDPQPPRVTSGIRIGTAALTTRGLKEAQMKQVAAWILQVLKNPKDEATATPSLAVLFVELIEAASSAKTSTSCGAN